jgi:hypothetical protein
VLPTGIEPVFLENGEHEQKGIVKSMSFLILVDMASMVCCHLGCHGIGEIESGIKVFLGMHHATGRTA